MRKQILLVIILFFTLKSYAQPPELHYIKFLHVGEKIMRVPTLNISFESGGAPADSTEVINDTLRVISFVTDESSYKTLLDYIKDTDFQLSRHPGKLEFGTFKIINDRKYFYLPDLSATGYFKKMVKYLKKKKSDPNLVSAIVDNYPWIFNP